MCYANSVRRIIIFQIFQVPLSLKMLKHFFTRIVQTFLKFQLECLWRISTYPYFPIKYFFIDLRVSFSNELLVVIKFLRSYEDIIKRYENLISISCNKHDNVQILFASTVYL